MEPQPSRFSAGYVTHPGMVRDHNEDAAIVAQVRNENGLYHLWAVADGMGGGAKGEVASNLAIQALYDCLAKGHWHNPEDALREGFAEANAAVYFEGTARGQAPRSLMGTTLVAMLVEEATGRAWVANVGDSRLYVVTAGGQQQVTRDHSLVAERLAAGLITEAEAAASRERNIITKAIGTESTVSPDVFVVFDQQAPMSANQRVVLCSDGLHGLVEPTRIGNLAGAGPAEVAAQALVDAANAAGGHDNITVLIGGEGATQMAPPGWKRVKPQRSGADRWRRGAKGAAIAAPAAAGVSAAGGRRGATNRDLMLAAVGIGVLLAVVAVVLLISKNAPGTGGGAGPTKAADAKTSASAQATTKDEPNPATHEGALPTSDADAAGRASPTPAGPISTTATRAGVSLTPPTTAPTATPAPEATPTPTWLASAKPERCVDGKASYTAFWTIAADCAARFEITDLSLQFQTDFCKKMKEIQPHDGWTFPATQTPCGVAPPTQINSSTPLNVPPKAWFDDWKEHHP